MSGGGKLRNRLILLFVAATLAPLGLTVWTSIELLDRSFGITPVRELDRLSRSFEQLGREYYQRSREWLKAEAHEGRVPAVLFGLSDRALWPAEVESFWTSGDAERFATAGEDGQTLQYLRRVSGGVEGFSRELGVGMQDLTREFAQARNAISYAQRHDLRRGFILTFVAVASVVWVAGMLVLIYLARRVTAPVGRLTRGLSEVAAGDLSARVEGSAGEDELGRAIAAFNDMAAQLQRSRENLIHVTRLSSWQALARKMAHEVKNSLTPIRLTMEEIGARSADHPDADFLRQASQIVVDEVVSLERRVRAFSELAAEPPVSLEPLDLTGVVEDRVAFLRSAHPAVLFQTECEPAWAVADADLLKGIVTNLIDNAAHAAREGGVVLVRTRAERNRVLLEVHDSGPGLSPHARDTVFEPTISFKKGGMGLGLSIARKSALLCRGDIELIEGALGGAAFRVTLPAAIRQRERDVMEPREAAISK
jgi:two-component system, NtrC family, nitrogen regulation sensor histidine kinase NtrY